MWLLLVLLLLFVLYGSHRYILDKRYRLPPGPIPVPFLGGFYLFKPGKPMWQTLHELSRKYGPVVTFYLGQIRLIVLDDPKIIHDTLVGQADIFSSRIDLALPGMEQVPPGLASASGEVWRQRRRFGMRAMRDFGMGKDAMATAIQDEVVHLLPEIETFNGKPFNPKRLINNAVANIICSLVFGKRFHYDDKNFHRILRDVERILSLTPEETVLYFVFPFIKYFSAAPAAKQEMTLARTVEEQLKEAIAENRKDFDPENIRGFPDLFIQSELQKDALDFQGFKMTMTDMFIAGTETTSTALAWTLIYLTTYPEIQAKCHEAIDGVIDTARLPTLQDRPQLVYIDAVMCEVLRHASFLPTNLLHSNLHTHAKILGYDIPPYTMVMYNVAALHRDPDYWKVPLVFRPERWIGNDGKLLAHSTHFMPFGIGPRICLGEALARVEYFIFLVSLLHRFQFSLKEPVDIVHEKEGVIRAAPDFEIIPQSR